MILVHNPTENPRYPGQVVSPTVTDRDAPLSNILFPFYIWSESGMSSCLFLFGYGGVMMKEKEQKNCFAYAGTARQDKNVTAVIVLKKHSTFLFFFFSSLSLSLLMSILQTGEGGIRRKEGLMPW
jgi:hypothetical protein